MIVIDGELYKPWRAMKLIVANNYKKINVPECYLICRKVYEHVDSHSASRLLIWFIDERTMKRKDMEIPKGHFTFIQTYYFFLI